MQGDWVLIPKLDANMLLCMALEAIGWITMIAILCVMFW